MFRKLNCYKVFSFLLLIIFFSCGEKKLKTHNYYINPKIWSLTSSWQIGTYWIMQDSATSQLDSILAYDSFLTYGEDYISDYHYWDINVLRLNDFVGTDTFSQMNFSVQAYDMKYGEITSLSFGFRMHDTGNNIKPEFYSYHHPNVITVPNKSVFEWNDIWYDTTTVLHGVNGVSYSELFPTYSINNQTYDSVFHVHNISSDSLLHLNDDFYYNRTHGILKIVQNNARIKRTLTLVREHLIRE